MATVAEARKAIEVLEARGDIAGAAAIRRDLSAAGLSASATDFEAQVAAERQQRLEQEERRRQEDLERRIELAELKRGSLARGLDIGTDIVAQATGSALEGIGGVLGLEGLEQYGAEVALENEADAQRKARFQTRFDDIGGIGDFGSYLGGIAAESTPQMGATLAGGATGAKIGAAFGPVGAGIGALVGGAAASLPFFYGMNRERQKEAIEKGIRTEVDEGAAALTAIPQATLDAILGRLFVGKLGLTNRAVGGGGIFTRGVKGTAAGAIIEAPTELGQQVLERAQAGLPLTSEDAIAEYREAAIAGGLLGGSIRGAATVAGGDVAAREDAQKAKEERDADARRAEIEATLAEETAVETEAAERQAEVERRIREGEGELELDAITRPAPPAVEATAEEDATSLSAKFFDDIGFNEEAEVRKELEGESLTNPATRSALRRAAAKIRSEEKQNVQANLEKAFSEQEIVSETVIEREGQPTETTTQTRKEFEAAVEEAQQETDATPTTITAKFFDDIGFGKTAKIREELTGKDLTDPDTRDSLRRAAAKTRSKKKLEIQANLEEAFKEQEVLDDQQRNISASAEGKPVAARSRTSDETDLSSVEDIARRTSAVEPNALVGEAMADAGGGAGRLTTGADGQPDTLTPTREFTDKGNEIRVLLEKDNRTPEEEARFVELVDEARADFARRQKPTEDTRDASLEFEEGAATEEQAEVGAETEAEAAELTEAIENLQRANAVLKGGERPAAKPVQIATSIADPDNVRTQEIRQFHADRVAEAKEFGEKPPTLSQSRDEFTVQEGLDPNVRRVEGTRYSAVGDADFEINEDVVAGRLTEQGVTTESDRLLRETKGGTLIDAVKNVARNANNPFERLIATNVSKLMQRMMDAGYKFEYEIEELSFNSIRGGTRGYMEPERGPLKVVLRRTKDPLALHNGLTHKTLLHEAVHAVTAPLLASGSQRSFPKGTKLKKDVNDLRDLFSGVIRYFNKRIADVKAGVMPETDLLTVERQFYFRKRNTLANPDEMLAWALTDREVQEFMDTIPYDTRTGDIGTEGKGTITLWEALVNALRKLLNLPPKDNTALNELLRVQNNLLAPDTAGIETAGRLYGALPKFSSRVDDNPALVSRPEKMASEILNGGLKSIPILDSKGVQRVRDVVSDASLPEKAKGFALGILSLNGLEMVAKKYIPKIGKVRDLVLKEGGRLQELKRPVDATISKISTFAKNNKEKVDILNRLMPYSSLIGVDPSKDRKTYEEDADKLAEYDAMHAKDGDWTALGEDGQRIYKVVRNTYKKLYDEIANVIKIRLEATDLDPKKRKNVYDELINKLYKNVTIDPYFPLIREGKYRLQYNATDPKTGQAEFFTESFETKRERREAIAELNAMADEIQLTNVLSFEGTEKVNYSNAPAGSFVNNVLGVLSANDVKPNVQDEIIKLFLDTLPERSFAQSFRRREGFRGFIGDPANLREAKYPNHDMVRALRIRTASVTRQIVRMEFGAELQKVQEELNEDFKAYNNNPNVSENDKQAAAQYLAEVEKRIDFAKNPNVEDWAKNLTTFGFAMTLGINLSSVLVNFSQIPMVIAPHLASTRGDDGEYFGYSDTLSAMGEAVRLFKNAGRSDENIKYLPFIKQREAPVEAVGPDGTEQVMVPSAPSIDNYDYNAEGIPPEVKEFEMLAKVAEETGQLNRSIMYDTLDMEEIDSIRGKIGAVSGFMFHHGERMTRQVALAAAYRLKVDSMKRAKNNLSKADFKALSAEEKANLKLSEAEYREAAEFAVYEVELTNGGTAAASAPRLAQQGIGKVAFLYKRYGVQMMELLAKLGYESIRGTPAEKAQARRQLFGVMGGAALVAGAQGLPMYGVAAMVYDMFKGDEDEDLDTVVRKTIGEELFGGMGNAVLGVDVASRMGLSDLVFRDRLIEKDQSFIFDLIEVFGGPVVGVSMQVGRGFDKAWNQGEVWRGAEAAAPAAVRNAMKSYRFYEDGAKTQRGDTIVDDISAPLLVMQFLGFAPAEYTRQLAQNAQLKKISGAAARQRTQLLRRYYAAVRSGDTSKARSIREDMNEFNRKFPSVRITPDTIKRSMAQHMKTSRKMHYGVTIDPRMMRDMRQSAAEYDDTLTIWDNLGM